jgi:hypothetical protein
MKNEVFILTLLHINISKNISKKNTALNAIPNRLIAVQYHKEVIDSHLHALRRYAHRN